MLHPYGEDTAMSDLTRPRVSSVGADATAERVTAFLKAVYGWMFVGLGLTGVAHYLDARGPHRERHIGNHAPGCTTPASYA